MSSAIPNRIQYISPGIVRTSANAFCLIYRDGGGSACFHGREPDGFCRGELYFPSALDWDAQVPALTTPRARVKDDLIAFAGNCDPVEFLAEFLSDEARIAAAVAAQASRL